MNALKTSKGTMLPIMDIKGKPYLQVAYRLVWFREEHPDWGIKTTVKRDNDMKSAVAYAEVSDATGRIIATGHKYEDAKGFADFIEKAETGAIGRALALCGYGTQFEPDLDEGDRLADAPLNKVPTQIVVASNSNKNAKGDRYISEAQVGRFFGKAFGIGMDRNAAKAWLMRNYKIEPESILANRYDGIITMLEGSVPPKTSKPTASYSPPPITDDDLPF